MNLTPPKPLGNNNFPAPSATLMPPTFNTSSPTNSPTVQQNPPAGTPSIQAFNTSMSTPPSMQAPSMNAPSGNSAPPPVNLAPTFGTQASPAPSLNSNLPAPTQPNFPSQSLPQSPTQTNPPPSFPAMTTPRDLPRSPGHNQSMNSAMPTKLASLASAAPGSRQIDGAQNPSMQIQKKAPEEVQVGQIATFALTVRNVGNATPMTSRSSIRSHAGQNFRRPIHPPIIGPMGHLSGHLVKWRQARNRS